VFFYLGGTSFIVYLTQERVDLFRWYLFHLTPCKDRMFFVWYLFYLKPSKDRSAFIYLGGTSFILHLARTGCYLGGTSFILYLARTEAHVCAC